MRFAHLALAGLLSLALAPAAHAQTFTVDQQQLNSNGGSGSLFFSPLGQEFVPTFDRLNRVVLRLADGTSVPDAFSFTVGIRQGSITGTLLGTSNVETRPNDFAPFNAPEDVNFDFATDVALTPGSLYVLEFNLLTGRNALFYSSGGNPYAPGRAIISGNPSANQDLYFQTGIVTPTSAVPEPGSVAFLVGITTTGTAFLRRRKLARKSA